MLSTFGWVSKVSGGEMREHDHEAIIGLDKILRCRICGQVLSGTERVVSKVTSSSRAKRILDEIAVAGRYQAVGFSDGFVIYSKISDELTTEVTARKIGERVFEVIRRIIAKGGDE